MISRRVILIGGMKTLAILLIGGLAKGANAMSYAYDSYGSGYGDPYGACNPYGDSYANGYGDCYGNPYCDPYDGYSCNYDGYGYYGNAGEFLGTQKSFRLEDLSIFEKSGNLV